MFGMSFGEILIIIILAIIVLGPDKLPKAMIEIAKFFKMIKRGLSDAKETFDKELNVADLKAEALEYKKKFEDATNELNSIKNVDMGIKKEFSEIKESFDNLDKKEIKPATPAIETIDKK